MRIQIISLLFLLVLIACKTATHMQNNINPIDQPLPLFDLEGHRGCRGLYPENTIEGMIKAIDLGVTTLEMDVVISKDRQVVVSHDPFFNHFITTTPEGKYIAEKEEENYLLYQMNYDSIRRYDVGMKPHPNFPKQEKKPAYKPLLSELIKATEKYTAATNKSMWYNIETKSMAGFDDLRHPAPEGFVDLLMEVINTQHIAHRTIIQSFDMRTLQALHKKYPEQKTALLIEPDEKGGLDEQLKSLGFIPTVYSPHFSLVTPLLVKRCHEQGMKLIPWTINHLELMQQLKTMGIDGLISDYPDLYKGLK